MLAIIYKWVFNEKKPTTTHKLEAFFVVVDEKHLHRDEMWCVRTHDFKMESMSCFLTWLEPDFSVRIHFDDKQKATHFDKSERGCIFASWLIRWKKMARDNDDDTWWNVFDLNRFSWCTVLPYIAWCAHLSDMISLNNAYDCLVLHLCAICID